jgi:AraC-like DNA-binding protein
MGGVGLSPFPHYSWLGRWLTIRPPRVFDTFESRHVTHRLLLTTDGDADTTWSTHGSEVLFHSVVGDIGFFPADHATHTLALTTTAGYRGYELFVPQSHLRAVCATEGLDNAGGLLAVPVFRDSLLLACMDRMSGGRTCHGVAEDIGEEVAARQIVMRLCVLAGNSPPEWHKDTSTFSPTVLRQIVERIDGNLGLHLSLGQVSVGFGLSPSHFARKFHRSIGCSLNRFVNRRRIGMSFCLLRTGSTPLSQLSLDLGFSSQSHFTRLFSTLTGLTPYQFRREHRRMDE